jgi:hypothetical protein
MSEPPENLWDYQVYQFINLDNTEIDCIKPDWCVHAFCGLAVILVDTIRLRNAAAEVKHSASGCLHSKKINLMTN